MTLQTLVISSQPPSDPNMVDEDNEDENVSQSDIKEELNAVHKFIVENSVTSSEVTNAVLERFRAICVEISSTVRKFRTCPK